MLRSNDPSELSFNFEKEKKNEILIKEKNSFSLKNDSFFNLQNSKININNVSNFEENSILFMKELNKFPNKLINFEIESCFENSFSEQNIFLLKKCKFILKKLEIHLNDNNNPLCKILKLYTKYFIETYSPFNNDNLSKNLNEIFYSDKLDSIYNDLQNFIKILRDTLYIFYSFLNLKGKNLLLFNSLSKETLLNFTMSICINEEIYSIIFNLQKKIDNKEEEIITKSFKTLYLKDPENLGISPKFCLNKSTINYLLENEIITNIVKKEEEILIFLKKNKPFCNAIDCFKNIQYLKSPYHKLKLLLFMTELILSDILEFYSFLGVSVDLNEIDSDEIMSIFLYIIAKSQVNSIYSQCNFIDKFITESILDSAIGYYFITLKASVLFFLENSEKDENCFKKLENLKINAFEKSFVSDQYFSFSKILLKD